MKLLKQTFTDDFEVLYNCLTKEELKYAEEKIAMHLAGVCEFCEGEDAEYDFDEMCVAGRWLEGDMSLEEIIQDIKIMCEDDF